MTPEEIERLVAAARHGDREAAQSLLEAHYDGIHRLCRRLMGNPADADDATQEALLAIVRGLPRFDGRSSFSTWIYRVSTNSCFDELRRRSRRPISAEPDDRAAHDDVSSEVADRDEADRWLAMLPTDFRTAVVLRDLCDLDYREIAEVLDLPIGTVRSRIARGRRALADHIGGNFSPAPDVERGDHE